MQPFATAGIFGTLLGGGESITGDICIAGLFIDGQVMCGFDSIIVCSFLEVYRSILEISKLFEIKDLHSVIASINRHIHMIAVDFHVPPKNGSF